MKAYLINPETCTIEEVEHNGDYTEIHKLIDAEHFDAAVLPNYDTVYVDDEGLFRDSQFFFSIKGYPNPLAGKGLVLGTDEHGESIDPKADLKWYNKNVLWVVPLMFGLWGVYDGETTRVLAFSVLQQELMEGFEDFL